MKREIQRALRDLDRHRYGATVTRDNYTFCLANCIQYYARELNRIYQIRAEREVLKHGNKAHEYFEQLRSNMLKVPEFDFYNRAIYKSTYDLSEFEKLRR